MGVQPHRVIVDGHKAFTPLQFAEMLTGAITDTFFSLEACEKVEELASLFVDLTYHLDHVISMNTDDKSGISDDDEIGTGVRYKHKRAWASVFFNDVSDRLMENATRMHEYDGYNANAEFITRGRPSSKSCSPGDGEEFDVQRLGGQVYRVRGILQDKALFMTQIDEELFCELGIHVEHLAPGDEFTFPFKVHYTAAKSLYEDKPLAFKRKHWVRLELPVQFGEAQYLYVKRVESKEA